MAAFHPTVGLLLGCARPRPRKPRSGCRTLGPSRASDRRLISHLHGRQRPTPLHRRPVAARYLLRASSVAAGTSPLARRSHIPLQSSGAEFGSARSDRAACKHVPCPGSSALAPAPTRQNRRSSPIEGAAPGLRLRLGGIGEGNGHPAALGGGATAAGNCRFPLARFRHRGSTPIGPTGAGSGWVGSNLGRA